MNQIKFYSLLAASSLILYACGGGESTSENREGNNQSTTSTQAPSQPAPAPVVPGGNDQAASEGEVVELSIEGNDQMQFNKKELRVKAGQTVRLTLTHVGTMPKNAMGHNFVLLKQGVDLAAFGQKSATAMENDYIPQSEEGNIIAHTKMLGGGESDTIEFTAPAAGEYEFLCSFPGHYALMRGKFIVE